MPLIDVVGQVSVPNVVGLDEFAASDALDAVFLNDTVIYAINASVAAGKVISQSIAAGTDVDPGTAITVIVSSGDGSCWLIRLFRQIGA